MLPRSSLYLLPLREDHVILSLIGLSPYFCRGDIKILTLLTFKIKCKFRVIKELCYIKEYRRKTDS